MNGTQEAKLQFKPRKTSSETRPDAPEGEWEAMIPKGKCKVLKTQAGDPRLIIPFKLVKAADEKNESFNGSEVSLSVIIFDDEDSTRIKAANMMKGRLRAACEWADADFAEVYPTEVSSGEDFAPLFQALEGHKGTVWTVHTTRQAESGETITDTEVRFKKPGAGLVTKGADDDDNEDRPGRKPAGKTKSRR